MRRLLKIGLLASVVLLLAGGGAAYFVYQAARRVPDFYHAAISLPAGEQSDARDAFVARATALAGDLHEDGYWQSLFTAEQINAWLALELAENYPGMLPGELRDPRVELRPGEATIGCRYQDGDLAAVVSLTFEAYLQEPNVLALRIRRVRAGTLPVPLAQVLDNISHAAQALNLRLEWRKSRGDPVALITLPPPRDAQRAALNLEKLELRDGELFVCGTMGPPSIDASPIVPEPLRVPTARRDVRDDTQPRVGSAEKTTRQE